MKSLKNIFTGAGMVVCLGMAAQVFAVDEIDADDFVDEASAKGIAEVEAGNLALKKSTSADVKAFAQQMIADHTKANAELARIAKTKKLEVATEAELTNKAKALILKQRDGESFDEAYANNQVTAHKETIELFKEGLHTEDADINAFAKATLPKLEHHLQMAEALARKTKALNADGDDRDDDDHKGHLHSSSASSHRGM
ncbi:MAG TPA: DUF4142 domain-containing protein [Cellvibrio sp.]|nr:DUF4142 domain-containing protein [Cellvibrio sp.]